MSEILGGLIFLTMLVVFIRWIGATNDIKDAPNGYRTTTSVQNADYQRDLDEKLQWAIEDYYQEQYFAQREEEMRAKRWENAESWEQYVGTSKYDQYFGPRDDYDPQEYLADYGEYNADN